MADLELREALTAFRAAARDTAAALQSHRGRVRRRDEAHIRFAGQMLAGGEFPARLLADAQDADRELAAHESAMTADAERHRAAEAQLMAALNAKMEQDAKLAEQEHR